MALEIRQLTASASFQDRGRSGFRGNGVPNGGAFDAGARALANALLGNDENAAILEMLAAGGVFRATAPISIAIAGAEPICTINGEPRAPCGVINLNVGDTLDVFRFERGNCLAMAAPGGFVCESMLGSCSGIKPIGSLESLESRFAKSRDVADAVHFWPNETLPIVVNSDSPKLDARFRVSPQSSRIGVRLQGASAHSESPPSRPTCPGLVQWTPGGELIIVGPDGPTLGGYPAIGFVPETAMGRVAQLVPGQEIRFETVEFDEIESFGARLERVLKMIRLSNES